MAKTALITGASSGIGLELAKYHASRKGDLVLVARREEELNALKEKLEKQYSIEVKVIVKDLSVSSAPQEIFDELQSEKITVDYLINNAGFGGYGKFHERELSDDLAMINVNIVALMALTRLFLPKMIEADFGKVMNVASTAAFMPGPLQSVYFATKAFVLSFSQAIAEEVSDTSVTVTTLCPGATKTEFAKVSNMESSPLFEKTATAEEVAREGYIAMLKGNLVEITEPSHEFQINWVLPFVPRKKILRRVFKMQQKK